MEYEHIDTKQKYIIGCIFWHRNDAIHILKRLEPEYFTDTQCREIFDVIIRYYKDRKEIPTHILVGETLCQEYILSRIYADTQHITLENAEELTNIIKSEYIAQKYQNEFKYSDITGRTPEELKEISERFISELQEIKQSEYARPTNAFDYMQECFDDDLKASMNRPPIKTGFENFDTKMGGIYPGLYTIGAISSLGKTTLIHQIADNIAQSGIPVLYFSLEMSTLELITKSLSRITLQKLREQGYNKPDIFEKCHKSIEIRSKGIYTEELKQALQIYKETISPNINIFQGDFSTDVMQVRNNVKTFIRNNTGKYPVVIIDYLQIMKPAEIGKGIRENIDFTVSELKRISRDFNIPVIVISSFNRNNYLSPVAFESFKESGNIEYSSDVVMGLQLEMIDSEEFTKLSLSNQRKSIDDAKHQNPRKIQLKILKSRYSCATDRMSFLYYPTNDLFIPFMPENTVFNVNANTQKGYKPNK